MTFNEPARPSAPDLEGETSAPANPPLMNGKLGPRIAALLVDLFAVYIAAFVLSLLFFGGETSDAAIDPEQQYLAALTDGASILTSILFVLYRTIFHAMANGATLGKQLFGLTVKTTDSERLSTGRSFGRALAQAILSDLILIGYLVAIFHPKSYTLHDLIASTAVFQSSNSESPSQST